MHKNIKLMFLLTTLVFLLVGLSVLTAADLSDDSTTTVTSNVTKSTNSYAASKDISSSDTTSNTKVTTESAKKSANNDDKNIETEDIAKNTKKSLNKQTTEKAIKTESALDTVLEVNIAGANDTTKVVDLVEGETLNVTVALKDITGEYISGQTIYHQLSSDSGRTESITDSEPVSLANRQVSLSNDGDIYKVWYEGNVVVDEETGSESGYLPATPVQYTILVQEKTVTDLTVDELDFDFTDDNYVGGSITVEGTLTEQDGTPLTLYDDLELLVYLTGEKESTNQSFIVSKEDYELLEGYSVEYIVPNRLGPGHTITVEFAGTRFYHGSSDQTVEDFEIVPQEANITITSELKEDYYVNDSIVIIGELRSNVTEELLDAPIKAVFTNMDTDTVIGEYVNNTVNGVFTFNVAFDQAALVNVNITVNDTGINASYRNNIIIDKHSSKINLTDFEELTALAQNPISGTVEEEFDHTPLNGTLTIYINDELITSTDVVEGVFNTNISYNDTDSIEDFIDLKLVFVSDLPDVYHSDELLSGNVYYMALEYGFEVDEIGDVVYGKPITITGRVTNHFNVNPEGIEVEVNLNKIEDGTETIVGTEQVTLAADGEFNVTFTQQGVMGSANVLGAKYGAQISNNLPIGEHSFTVMVIEDDDLLYYSPEEEYNFNVVQMPINITVNKPMIATFNKKPVTINGTVTGEGTPNFEDETVEVFVDDVSIGNATINANNKYQITYTPTVNGTYNVLVKYSGNELYAEGNATTIMVVDLQTTEVNIEEIDNTALNQTVKVIGNVTSLYTSDVVTGNVRIIVKIDDESIYDQQVELVDGAFETDDIKVTKLGTADVIVLFIANDEFDNSESTVNFDVEPLAIVINITSEESIIRENAKLNITIKDEYDTPINGTVNVYIINPENEEEIYDGLSIVDGVVTGLNYVSRVPGIHNVTVEFVPTAEYLENEEEGQFNVILNANITINEPGAVIYVNDTYVITGKLTIGNETPEGISLTLLVDGEAVTEPVITDSNGTYTYNYRSEERKEFVNVTVQYAGEPGKNATAANTTWFMVEPHNTEVVIDPIDNTIINATINITGSVIVSYNDTKLNGTVRVKVGDRPEENVTLTEGKFTYSYSQDNEETDVSVIVIYDGTPAYDRSEDTVSFDVEKIGLIFDIIVDDTVIGDDAVINVSVMDENDQPFNGTVSVIVTDSEGTDHDLGEFDVVDGILVNGTETGIKFATTVNGTHTVTVEVEEDEYFANSIEEAEFNVTLIPSSLTINDPLTVIYVNDTLVITGVLTINNETAENIALSLSIDGIPVNEAIITGTDGVYAFNYTSDSRKERVDVTITYDGEEGQIAGATNSTWIIVEPHTTEVIVDLIDNTIINATVNVTGRVVVVNNDTKLNGTVRVVVGNDIEQNVTLVDGNFNTTFTFEEAVNDVNVIVIFDGTPAYDSSFNDSVSFDVEKIGLIFDIIADDTVIGDDAVINVSVMDENEQPFNGKVSVIVTDSEGTDHDLGEFDVVDGILVNGTETGIKFATTVNGTHTVTVATEEDNYFVAYEEDEEFNVTLVPSNITISEMAIIFVNDNFTITGVLSVDDDVAANGTEITLTIDDEEPIALIIGENGVYEYNYTSEVAKDLVKVTVEYAGVEGQVASAANSTWIIVEPHATEVIIDPIDNIVINATGNISGRVVVVNNDTLLNGQVLISVGDAAPVPVELINGSFSYTNFKLEEAEDDVEVIVSFVPTSAYDISSSTASFDVEKLDVTIDIEAPETVQGNPVEFDINVTDENGNPVNGEAIVTITSGPDYEFQETYNVTDGKIIITDYIPPTNGTYLINVEVSDDDYYIGTYEEAEFNVTTATNITINEMAIIFVNDTFTITGVLSIGDAVAAPGTNITLTIDDEEPITLTIGENGVYEYNYTSEEAKELVNVTVEYAGVEGKVGSSTNRTWIIVEPHATQVELDPIENTVINATVNISGKVTVLNNDTKLNGTVKVKVGDNDPVTVNLTDGVFSYPYSQSEIETDINVLVVYEGTPAYSDSFNETSFDVEILDTLLTVQAIPNIENMGEFIITVKLSDELKNPINTTVAMTIKNNNNSQVVYDNESVVITNGIFTLPFEADPDTEYSVVVVYDGVPDVYLENEANDTFNSSSIITNLEISDDINLTPIVYNVGDNISLVGNLTYDNKPIPKANISIYIDDELVGNVTTDDDGTFYFTDYVFNEAKDGVKVTAKFEEYGLLTGSNDTVILMVEKRDSKVMLEKLGPVFSVTETATITGLVTDKYDENTLLNGTVDILIDDVVRDTVPVVNGRFEYNYTFTTEDLNDEISLPITARFIPSDETKYMYDGSENTTLVGVSPLQPTIVIDPIAQPQKVDKAFNITGTVTDNLGNKLNNTEIYYKLNDGSEVPITTDDEGKFSIEITPDTVGVYNITVGIDPSDLYDEAQEEANFTVNNITQANIEVDPIGDLKVDTNTTVSGTVTDEDGNPIPGVPVQVTLNNETVNTTTDDEGKFALNVAPTTGGPTNITVSVPSEGDIMGDETTQEVDVAKQKPTMTVDPINDAKAEQPTTISGKVTDENGNPVANQPVNIKVNNETIPVTTDENGKFNTTVKPKDGPNTVTVSMPESDKYDAQPVTKTFEAEKVGTKIINLATSNQFPVVGEQITITGNLVDETNRPLTNVSITVKVGDKTINATTGNNGRFSVPYTPQEVAKNVPVEATYAGNSTHSSSQNSTWIDAEILGTELTIDPIKNATVGTPTTITGTVKDENGKPVANQPVIVTVDGIPTPATTDSNGKFSVPFTPTTTGNHTVKVEYPGDGTHQEQVEEATIPVDKVTTKATIDPVTNAVPGTTKDITGKVTDSNGKPVAGVPVTVNVNGKNYPATTDNNGNYKVTPNNIVEGTNTVTTTVPGDNKYKPTTQTTTFKANKLPTKATIDPIKNPVYGADNNITGKVTDSNGKPVANTPVTVNVNGKDYPTKTDNNGNYAVKPTNIVAGTNNVTTTVPGNVSYAPTSAKQSFQVSKNTPKLTINNIPDAAPGDNVTISGKLVDANNKPVSNKPVTVMVNNKQYNATTNANGEFSIVAPNVSLGDKNVTASFTDPNYNSAQAKDTFKVKKLNVTVKVPTVIGKVGEQLTLLANVTDEKGNPVTSGNVVFKLNGRSLRTDLRFDSNAAALKIPVVNGKVDITMIADLYLRSGKNITASYSGSFRYLEAQGNTAKAEIQLRDVKVRINVKPTSVKQNTDLTITAYAYDVTKNAKNTTSINTNATMMFKINGKTLKDAKGKVVKVPVVNGSATYKYHIDSGVGGIDNNKNVRNYTVTAVYSNTFFYPKNNKNTTNYTVQRSPININIKSATVSKNILTVKANITDYQGKLVNGTNKVTVKVNGATYKENGQYKYWNVKNGQIDISGIRVSATKKLTKIEVVTGERQAYLEGRKVYTNIVYS